MADANVGSSETVPRLGDPARWRCHHICEPEIVAIQTHEEWSRVCPVLSRAFFRSDEEQCRECEMRYRNVGYFLWGALVDDDGAGVVGCCETAPEALVVTRIAVAPAP